MYYFKKLFLFIILTLSVLYAGSFTEKNQTKEVKYKHIYKDINLYQDISENAPYEVGEYYRLAVINMIKY